MSLYRQPVVAGLFYPAGYWKLKEELKLLLDSAIPEQNFENIFGIISPHAGYLYSGKTAAYVYNLVRNKSYENIFIISPSHREYFPGISVYNGDGYETPIGKIPVNKEIIDKLVSGSKVIFKGAEGHRDEHGIEVQIPFLQFIFDNEFKIIPIVMGDQSGIFIDELASALSKVVDDKSLIIASSDLSHYYSKKEASKLDAIIEHRINNFDYKNLNKDLEKKVCEACGGGPIVALMRTAALLNKNKSMVIHRSDSGDVTGDFKEVVGYLSAVIYEEK